MSILFHDTFARANQNGLGNGWNESALWQIITNRACAQYNAQWAYRDIGGSCPNDVIARLQIDATSPYNATSWIAVYARGNAQGVNSYMAAVTLGGVGTAKLELFSRVGGTNTLLGSYTGFALTGGQHSIAVSCVGSTIKAYLDDVARITVTDTTTTGGTCAGILIGAVNVDYFNDFLFSTPQAPTFAVFPTMILRTDGPRNVFMVGFGTAWTPGGPGSPVFTVSAGTIVSQSVMSDSMCVISYIAPLSSASVVFTDPTNGSFSFLNITSGDVGEPSLVGSLQDWVLTKVADYTTALAGEAYLATGQMALDIQQIVSQLGSSIDESSVQESLAALRARWVTFVSEWNAGDLALPTLSGKVDTLQGTATNISDWFLAYVGITGITAQNIMDAITGVGVFAPTDLSGVLAAIAAIPPATPTDLTPVLDAISAIPPDVPTDLTPVLDAVGALVPFEPTDLSGVLSAIADLVTTNFPAILSAILAVVSGGETTIATVITDVLGVGTDLSAVKTELDTVKGDVETLLARPPVGGGPPLWPGAAGVTLGTPVSLADGVDVEGPMHGILMDVTEDYGTKYFLDFAGHKSYSHWGQVAFADADGYCEAAQFLSFGKHVVCPKTIAAPAHAYIRLSKKGVGTITPWVLSG